MRARDALVPPSALPRRRRSRGGLPPPLVPIGDNLTCFGHVFLIDQDADIAGSRKFSNATLQELTLNSRFYSCLLQLVHDKVSFDIAGCVKYGFHTISVTNIE